MFVESTQFEPSIQLSPNDSEFQLDFLRFGFNCTIILLINLHLIYFPPTLIVSEILIPSLISLVCTHSASSSLKVTYFPPLLPTHTCPLPSRYLPPLRLTCQWPPPRYLLCGAENFFVFAICSFHFALCPYDQCHHFLQLYFRKATKSNIMI